MAPGPRALVRVECSDVLSIPLPPLDALTTVCRGKDRMGGVRNKAAEDRFGGYRCGWQGLEVQANAVFVMQSLFLVGAVSPPTPLQSVPSVQTSVKEISLRDGRFIPTCPFFGNIAEFHTLVWAVRVGGGVLF